MLIFRNGSRNSVNLYPSIVERMIPLMEQYNDTWYAMQQKIALEELLQDSAKGICAGSYNRTQTKKFIIDNVTV